MKLDEWLRQATAEQRIRCAETARTSVNRLYQIAGGHSPASAGACRLIALGTDFAVSPHEIRADYFPYPDDGLPPSLRCRCEQPRA